MFKLASSDLPKKPGSLPNRRRNSNRTGGAESRLRAQTAGRHGKRASLPSTSGGRAGHQSLPEASRLVPLHFATAAPRVKGSSPRPDATSEGKRRNSPPCERYNCGPFFHHILLTKSQSHKKSHRDMFYFHMNSEAFCIR